MKIFNSDFEMQLRVLLLLSQMSSGKLNDAPIGRLFAAFSVGASGVRCFICGLLVTFLL